MNIKTNDLVLITIGKDSGKTGKVEKVFGKTAQIIVSGRNIVKKHAKPSAKYPKGGIIDLPKPIDISNVRIICPKCNKITSAKISIIQDKKIRICKLCQENLDSIKGEDKK
ncbi:MAG: large subunit ribosomal protein L24 [Candidatus Berkelbacteria bacterium Licking1014_85]|uniref:Large ribosomal subunit protein uL24 n=1 Tax=Candidatus Berkelbacteria bacterium Licking1014_85 TaxID=2017148 RepID=A0A554LM28_9BACT|nr:MAG: large subunit ribosomal protein L24 [Candidatus Berkelbacteria bacterium Licking1014_85]